MIPEVPKTYGLLYYPHIGHYKFLHQFRAATPLSRESWSCKPVILMFPTFSTSRFREILAAKCGREMGGKFSLKMPEFQIAFRDLLHAVNLRHGTHSFTSLPKEGVLMNFGPE
jgi:hypothetical protein